LFVSLRGAVIVFGSIVDFSNTSKCLIGARKLSETYERWTLWKNMDIGHVLVGSRKLSKIHKHSSC